VELTGYRLPRFDSVRGVVTGWTAVDMPTPLLPEVVPGIDADDPVTFFLRGQGVSQV